MYFGDHAPPHVHARYSGDEATIVIATGEILDGWLPPRALRLVRVWLSEHRDELVRTSSSQATCSPCDRLLRSHDRPDQDQSRRAAQGPLALLARGGVFAEIRDDRQTFEQVRVNAESHTIEWPGGLDLDPEVLYGRHEPATGARVARRTVKLPTAA
jgi:hypothetical protein